MMTRLRNTIRIFAVAQLLVAALWLVSFEFFINFEVAFLSAFLIMLGSMYSYSKLVQQRVAGYEGVNEDDLIEKIDDPYDLYDDTPVGEADEEADLKSVVKEEKKRLKGKGVKNLQKSAPAVVSIYRMIPYALLVFGFVGLQNNQMLSLFPYLTGLGFGIAVSFFSAKGLFTQKQ